MDKFLNPEEFNIDNVFKGKYNIPIYQRPYSWQREQVTQLLKDIENSYSLYKKSNNEDLQVNNEELLLFAGTLFIKTERNVKNTYVEYDIVDGQQRITTFTLILMVILNRLYLLNSEDEVVTEIENYLWKKDGRKREKTQRVLTLGNIDKDIMIELFDKLFSKSDIISFANDKEKSDIDNVEKNLLDNLLVIDNYFKNFETEDEYYDYFEYIKYNIRFIAIEVHTKLAKLFSIFESINSKGKPLEDIDKIKSYIFQNIDESDYDEYLKKWGRLIIETNDNLMDYLTVYIRANISYYRQSIKLLNFKTLVENALKEYYHSTEIENTMTCFIDDMLKNVKYYNMLSDAILLESINISKKAVVFFMMNNIAEYQHTKALYFKLLLLKENNKISDEVFEKLVEYAFKFILTFQSVSSRESKQTASVFVEVQNEIYKEIKIFDDKKDLSDKKFDNIIQIFNKKIVDNSISDGTLRNNIRNAITYRKNKKVAKVILSYLEYQAVDGKVDFVKLYWLLKMGKDIHVDHILPLSPKEDADFKYYLQDDSIIVKEGHDFKINSDSNRIGKDDFYDDNLHIIGNLRLEWASENIKKSNHLIVIKEYDKTFNTNQQISLRTTLLIKQIIDSQLLLSMDKIGNTKKYSNSEELYEIQEYEKSFSYQKYRPASFVFLGETYNLEKYNYTQLLIKILDVLYYIEAEHFIQLANEKYCPMNSDSIYISTEKEDVRPPFHSVDSSIYVGLNLSSEYIIKFIYMLIKEFGLNYDDLKISLKLK